MVSNPKRMRYVSESNFSSSEGEGFDDDDYSHPNKKTSDRHSKSNGKWLSRNAIMARENRLKKKLYISNLETEVSELKTKNTNFSKVIESQSLLISDLKNEIKYLKSVIANSTDIGRLIRNVHHNTGMSVTTSLDQSLSLSYVSKLKQPIARKTAHPWEEKTYPSFPTPESDLAASSLNDDFNDNLLNVELNEFLGDNFINPVDLEEGICDDHLKEHNYTSVQDGGDVGVCLHVSKHRVSLEFCSSCSDNATQAWNN